MLSTALDYLNITAVAVGVTFVLTLVFATKIKDFFTGVPTSLRASLTSIETSVKSDVANYQSSLVAKIAPTPPLVVKPAAPVTPVAPVAPVPPVA